MSKRKIYPKEQRGEAEGEMAGKMYYPQENWKFNTGGMDGEVKQGHIL